MFVNICVQVQTYIRIRCYSPTDSCNYFAIWEVYTVGFIQYCWVSTLHKIHQIFLGIYLLPSYVNFSLNFIKLTFFFKFSKKLTQNFCKFCVKFGWFYIWFMQNCLRTLKIPKICIKFSQKWLKLFSKFQLIFIFYFVLIHFFRYSQRWKNKSGIFLSIPT